MKSMTTPRSASMFCRRVRALTSARAAVLATVPGAMSVTLAIRRLPWARSAVHGAGAAGINGSAPIVLFDDEVGDGLLVTCLGGDGHRHLGAVADLEAFRLQHV